VPQEPVQSVRGRGGRRTYYKVYLTKTEIVLIRRIIRAEGRAMTDYTDPDDLTPPERTRYRQLQRLFSKFQESRLREMETTQLR